MTAGEKHADSQDNLKAQLKAILDSTHDGIYIVDGQGIFLEVNKGVERITGLRKEELLGRRAMDLADLGVIDRSVTAMVLERKEKVTIVQRITSSNKIKEVMITSTPILNKHGQPQYIVANMRDMTELNRLEHECEKARQLSNQYYSELQKEKIKVKIVAESPDMRRVLDYAYRVSQVDSTVLLEGESGVGKEVIANFIHEASARNKGPFISINCAAVPENLLEAELFGYEAGAFTSAKKEGKMGLIELAEKGTLFLDEIDSFPISLQGKLLRALETLEISRLGSTKKKKVDVRILAATNKNLKENIERGLFRNDLYFRLNVVPIQIPPLRQRKEDIIPLTLHFLNLYNQKYNKQVEVSAEALKFLESYAWPGNIRELKNIIERMVVMNSNTIIGKDLLPAEIYSTHNNESFKILLHEVVPLRLLLKEAEKQLLTKALNQYHTTRQIARALKISQASVVRKLSDLTPIPKKDKNK